MEQIGKTYGRFILEGIAVVFLTVLLLCGSSSEGTGVGILAKLGEYLPQEDKNYELYSDFRDVYKQESLKSAPRIEYVTGAADAGIVSVDEIIKAYDYDEEELELRVLSIKNMEGEELVESYDSENMEINLEYAGIYVFLVEAVDDGNRVTKCSIRVPVNSRIGREESE